MKTSLVLLLAGMVLLCSIHPVAAQQADVMAVEQIKIKVAKLGVGEKAKATVFLRDGRKIKGYIAQAGEEDFVVRDRRTDAASTVRYLDVTKVDSNRGHSTARNIAIGVGIGVGAFLAILAITIAHLD
jgi:acetylglutamate synthase